MKSAITMHSCLSTCYACTKVAISHIFQGCAVYKFYFMYVITINTFVDRKRRYRECTSTAATRNSPVLSENVS